MNYLLQIRFCDRLFAIMFCKQKGRFVVGLEMKTIAFRVLMMLKTRPPKWNKNH